MTTLNDFYGFSTTPFNKSIPGPDLADVLYPLPPVATRRFRAVWPLPSVTPTWTR